MPEPTAFDPRKHLILLKGKQYLEVRNRVQWLRAEHPDAAIETEMIERGPDFATFRARVTLPSGASATGWGTETKSDFNDFLEKAETKSLGRALAHLGFGTQFAVEIEDGASQDRPVDSPVQPRPKPIRPAPTAAEVSGKPEPPTDPVTVARLRLYAAVKAAKWDGGQATRFIRHRTGKENSQALTPEEAHGLADLIERNQRGEVDIRFAGDGPPVVIGPDGPIPITVPAIA